MRQKYFCFFHISKVSLSNGMKFLAQLAEQNIDELYVSFDIDAIDDSYASATGTPEPDGLMPSEAMQILRVDAVIDRIFALKSDQKCSVAAEPEGFGHF